MAKFTDEELLLRKIERKIRKAMIDFSLIEDGDKLLVGLSGGKDSLALIDLLGRRKKIHKPSFQVVAAHISMTNIGYVSDLEYLRNHCLKNDIEFIHFETSFDMATDNRKSPCFLCSWTRRKTLFEIAKKYNCNKIVLGHHQDDILQTLLMNMTFQGAFGTMPPKLKMDKFDMTIIRPLCLVPESDLIELSLIKGYIKQKKACPYETSSSRPEMKNVIKMLEQMNEHARFNLWSSMTNIQSGYLPNLNH
ncbi:MAG: ATP-binding protein [Bacteroidales bacterium]|nr:ATP-binding protein [Bacteroidales bacterium]